MDANQPNRPTDPPAGDEPAGREPPGDEPPRREPPRREPAGREPAGAEPERAAAPPEQDRRSGEERRVEREPVAEDRRVETRRAEDRKRARAEQRHEVVDRLTLAVDYLFYLLYGLLGLRFLLAVLGASENAGFVRFVNGLTEPFYAPFSGIVGRPALDGGYLDFPLIIAVLAYVLLHIAVRGLLRLIAGDRTVP